MNTRYRHFASRDMINGQVLRDRGSNFETPDNCDGDRNIPRADLQKRHHDKQQHGTGSI